MNWLQLKTLARFKLFALFVPLLLLAAACGGAEPTPTATAIPTSGEPSPTSTPAVSPAPGTPEVEANFRFLVSDDINAIDQFQSLEVTISRIGLQRGGESGKWIEMPPHTPTVDLTQLQGDNAQEIWSGTLPDGTYTKVFVYVDAVSGVLKTQPNQTVDVKLPSNKLQISKPFEVATGTEMTFVYDLTVIAAGNPKSGIKYILKPQIGQSGADQRFREVKPAKADKEPKVKGELAFQLEGDVVPGGAATITLTHLGAPLANVSIELNDLEIGVTDASGRLAIQIPPDADELELETKLKGKLEMTFGTVPPQAPEISGELTLQLDGEVSPGATVTLTVTHQGTPLANVPIELNDEEIGATDALGQLSLKIPPDIQEMELEAKLEGEFEIKFREEKVESQEFKGTIAAITEGAELGSPWTVTIPGIQDPVTVYVLEVEHGPPQVGSEVKFEGVLLEGAILDAEAELEKPDREDKDEDKGKPETPGRPKS